MKLNPDFGIYGGKVNRRINTTVAVQKKDGDRVITVREPKVYMRGEELSPEVTKEWPLKNRLALSQSGQVQFYEAPRLSPEEQAAQREAHQAEELKRLLA